jgi:hypothetical protein
LGLIITFGIWTANKSLKQGPGSLAQNTSPTPQLTPAPIPTASPANKISLNVSTPADETLTNATTIALTGKTVPNAAVAVLFESGETILTASDAGDFSFEVPLEGGFNRISVKAFDQNGDSSTQNLTVTYTTQKI